MKILKTYRRVTMGLIRVVLLLLASAVLIVVLSFQSATAQADDAMMELGRHLIALSEAGVGAGQRSVLLNGQELGFRVFMTEQELDTSLDFYEEWCHGNVGEFADQEQALRLVHGSASSIDQQSRSWKDFIMRDNDGETGYVACLKHGMADASMEELLERFKRFLASGNLKDLGHFHYASVTKTDSGTRVVALWTEGDFFPATMFPLEGDAPGFDPVLMSRPPSGRRILSAGEAGETGAMSVYVEIRESIPELVRFYRENGPANGWTILSDAPDGEGGHLLFFQQGDEMRALSISSPEEVEGQSVVFASTRQ